MSLIDRPRKARGAFFTPPAISQFIVDWAIRSSDDSVLEPSCGDAAFLLPSAARLSTFGTKKLDLKNQLFGVDIHGPSVVEAAARLQADGFEASIIIGDFFDQSPQPIYDTVIGNPPYVRYQQFSGAARAKSLQVALAHGVRLTSLASSWAAFTIHASEFLKPEGRLGLVLPAELLSVNYASQVRRFLLNRFAKVRLIIFEQLLFPGILEEVVLLLAEGRGTSKSFEVYQARDANSLTKIDTKSWRDFMPSAGDKWTPALIPTDALEVYRDLTQGAHFTKLIEWGDTYLGSVTGNNDFFTLTAEDIERFGLARTEVKKISPPGARHLRGLTFSEKAWTQLAKDGARCFLFAPPHGNLSDKAQAYIAKGEAEGVHKAYKCQVRAPWWRVPLVAQPDLLFTYMNHERPRLTTNEAEAFVLNSLYGVKLKPETRTVGKATLPVACLNTLTLLGSEVVGRSYGGGLLKHEPKEADLLPVPSFAVLATLQTQLQMIVPQLSVALRQNNLLKAVELVDTVILERHLKLDPKQLIKLRDAREALFQRRVKRGRGTSGEN
ncbi:SAM-dependent methyltransferase [Mesorhizobium caraganae]|uniref:site-specific DNA-methyltransferase (adenine-specific) n=1 Tax=Mesorhizobium caraganae TaxID=483206 RepID=A0ABV1YUB4_9HYPH